MHQARIYTIGLCMNLHIGKDVSLLLIILHEGRLGGLPVCTYVRVVVRMQIVISTFSLI